MSDNSVSKCLEPVELCAFVCKQRLAEMKCQMERVILPYLCPRQTFVLHKVPFQIVEITEPKHFLQIQY